MDLKTLYTNAINHYEYTHNIIGFILTHQTDEKELTKQEINEIVEYVFANKSK